MPETQRHGTAHRETGVVDKSMVMPLHGRPLLKQMRRHRLDRLAEGGMIVCDRVALGVQSAVCEAMLDGFLPEAAASHFHGTIRGQAAMQHPGCHFPMLDRLLCTADGWTVLEQYGGG